MRTTAGGASGSVRNLRIREDTAKYLLNLDPTSAHYDPKSRSMREDPTPNKDPKEKTFAGDNFVRQSGDFHQWQSLNLHSIVAHEAGSGLHMQAVPSQAEAMFHQFKQRKAKVESKTKQSVLEAYGNAAETPAEPELLLGQTERYPSIPILPSLGVSAPLSPFLGSDVALSVHWLFGVSFFSADNGYYGIFIGFVRLKENRPYGKNLNDLFIRDC